MDNTALPIPGIILQASLRLGLILTNSSIYKLGLFNIKLLLFPPIYGAY